MILVTNGGAFATGFESNYVVAYVRALSGPAIEKSPQTNAIIRDLSFRYRLVSEVSPFNDWNNAWINFREAGLSTNEILLRSNAWRIAQNKQDNLHEIRLLFRWPIDSKGNAGNQRQVFRTMVSGNLVRTNLNFDDPDEELFFWLMQSSTYTPHKL